MEHRYAARKHVAVVVELRTPDGVVRKGCIKDVSATGASLIMMGGVPPQGHVVELSLPPPRDISCSESSPIRGFVVRVQGDEIGLLWLEDCDWRHIGHIPPMQLRS